MIETSPLLLRVLAGEKTERPPVWFMRQAGRYLPEYRELRSRAPDFVSFCLNPAMAAEATLQPMRRFPFDAAIVFADILLIPKALGQEVRFEAGEGPRLGALPSIASMSALTAGAGQALEAVGETLERVREALEPERTLIGFCGGPWTVATYMLDGQAKEERAAVRRYAYEQPALVDALLEVLVEASAHYLAMQVRRGAQVVKIFESWADGLSEDLFHRLVIGPHQRLIARFHELAGPLPVIGFPRGADALAVDYARAVKPQAVALDTSAALASARTIQADRPVQGALDPLLLRAGGEALDAKVDWLLEHWGAGGGYIFNLGHGIVPDTPPEHVAQVLKRVTGR